MWLIISIKWYLSIHTWRSSTLFCGNFHRVSFSNPKIWVALSMISSTSAHNSMTRASRPCTSVAQSSFFLSTIAFWIDLSTSLFLHLTLQTLPVSFSLCACHPTLLRESSELGHWPRAACISSPNHQSFSCPHARHFDAVFRSLFAAAKTPEIQEKEKKEGCAFSQSQFGIPPGWPRDPGWVNSQWKFSSPESDPAQVSSQWPPWDEEYPSGASPQLHLLSADTASHLSSQSKCRDLISPGPLWNLGAL